MDNNHNPLENKNFPRPNKLVEEFKVPANYFDELPLQVNSKIAVKEKSNIWMIWSGSLASMIGILFFVLISYQNKTTSVVSVEQKINYVEEYVQEEVTEDEVIEYIVEEDEEYQEEF